MNADGSGFRFVKNAELRSEAFGAPEWARDGKSIFCHDLDNIYQIDLDGNVLKKWELSKILTDASMPAFVKSRFGASGRSDDDGTMVCSFSRKKSRNDLRMSEPVIITNSN